jgi:deoxyribonuclease IV
VHAASLVGMVSIGPHVHDEDPLAAAVGTESHVVQFFLGDPQGWADPKFPGGDAEALREALAGAQVQACTAGTSPPTRT